MPDTCFPEIDVCNQGEPARDLAEQADRALVAGDREHCLALISELYETLDRRYRRLSRFPAAAVLTLSSLGAFDLAFATLS